MPDWNQRYADGECAGQTPLALIQRIVLQYPPGDALDLACGLGRHALYLAGHGWRVTAMDNSEVAIGALRDAARMRGLSVQARVCDLEQSEFAIEPGGYDLIVDSFYLQRSLIPRIREGVRAGGLAAFALPMIDDTAGLKPMNPEFLVEAGEVRRWFEDWEIVEHTEERDSAGRRRVAQLLVRAMPLRSSSPERSESRGW